MTKPTEHSTAPPQTLRERFRALRNRVANNIDLINLYAREKDIYKLLQVGAAWLAGGLNKWLVPKRFNKSLKQAEADIDDLVRQGKHTDAHFERKKLDGIKAHTNLVAGMAADTANTGSQTLFELV